MSDIETSNESASETEADAQRHAVHLPVIDRTAQTETARRAMEANPSLSSEAHVPSAEATPPAVSTAPATAEPSPGVESPPATEIEKKLLEGKVIEALRQIYDPEIPVNIHELGLIYNIDVRDDRSVHVVMTLTAPACPVAGTLPGEVERKIDAIPEVKSATVELVWEPSWCREMMSEAAQLTLGFL